MKYTLKWMVVPFRENICNNNNDSKTLSEKLQEILDKNMSLYDKLAMYNDILVKNFRPLLPIDKPTLPDVKESATQTTNSETNAKTNFDIQQLVDLLNMTPSPKNIEKFNTPPTHFPLKKNIRFDFDTSALQENLQNTLEQNTEDENNEDEDESSVRPAPIIKRPKKITNKPHTPAVNSKRKRTTQTEKLIQESNQFINNFSKNAEKKQQGKGVQWISFY